MFPPEQLEFFEREVRPVLVDHCYSCHGPDTQKLGLRVDSRAALLGGSEEGPVVALSPEGHGDTAASRLVQVISHAGEVKMPPKEKLPDAAIAALTHWVELGLPWPAEEKPKGPATMAEKIEQARAEHWAFQPVQMPPLPEVKAREWVRDDIDAFVLAKLESAGLAPAPDADKRTLLRRLYFDLTGLPPTVEQVQAFEAEADPGAYEKIVDQLLASPGYGERWARHWLDVARYADTKGYVFQEEREFPFSYTYRDYVIRAFNEDLPYDQFIRQQLAADQMDLGEDQRPLAAMGFLTLGRRFVGNVHDITDDRIDVTMRGLLGLTVGCARCHDHKFDPIPTADYYSLYGVFRSAKEPDELPLIAQPDPENPLYQAFLKELAEKEAEVGRFLTQLHTTQLAEAREKAADYLLAAQDARDMDEEALKALARDRQLLWQLVDRWRALLKQQAAAPDNVFAPWLAFAALPAEGFEAAAAALAQQIVATKTVKLTADTPVNAKVAQAFEGDAPKSLAEVAERYRTILRAADKQWTDVLVQAATVAQQKGAAPSLPDALADADAEAVRQALYGAASPANIPEGDAFMLSDVPTQGQVRQRRNAVDRLKATHPGRPPRAMSLVDGELFNPYVFKRGKPENKGEEIPRRFLAALSVGERQPFEHGAGRIDLANAIASADNPLTARVMVNRIWMYHFGRALVDTTSDFGVRSDAPSHPALLDHLARRFMDDGWSIKKLQRAIVLSAVYQQGSTAREDALAKDPENRLLWRQNRQRLDFESMRDALLAVSGKLDPFVGGESLNIEQEPFSGRRTLYARIERQNLPTIFRTFDFAVPDTHSPKRFRTTVPQQALFMLNSPFMIEQARALAARRPVAEAAGEEDRIAALYQLALQRAPADEEITSAKLFVDTQGTDAPAPPAWQYGYGEVEEASLQLASFTPLPHFSGDAWRGGPDLPDPQLGWVHLTRTGGHPGKAGFAAVRRWTAPHDGMVTIAGEVEHPADAGDGVVAYLISSRRGIVWRDSVKHRKAAARVDGLKVEAGESLDFVIACGHDENSDGFSWQPAVKYHEDAMAASGGSEKLEYRAAEEFAGPAPTPLAPWEKLAQVLLCTNEFLFVD